MYLPSVLWRYWLGGRKGIRPVKKLSGGVLAWLSVWREVKLACGPADSTAAHCLFLQFDLSGTGSPDKWPLNGCVYVCMLLPCRCVAVITKPCFNPGEGRAFSRRTQSTAETHRRRRRRSAVTACRRRWDPVPVPGLTYFVILLITIKSLYSIDFNWIFKV